MERENCSMRYHGSISELATSDLTIIILNYFMRKNKQTNEVLF